jgi:hypothetical protein
MSDKLRARARELALSAYWTTPFDVEKQVNAIEAVILQGMREALREEPNSEEMELAYALSGISIKAMWREIAESRARGLE